MFAWSGHVARIENKLLTIIWFERSSKKAILETKQITSFGGGTDVNVTGFCYENLIRLYQGKVYLQAFVNTVKNYRCL